MDEVNNSQPKGCGVKFLLTPYSSVRNVREAGDHIKKEIKFAQINNIN